MKSKFASVLLPAFILLFSMALASCDCLQQVSGRVTDGISKKPVSGAVICLKQKQYNQVVSDSAGNFSLSNITGGLRPGVCRNMELLISCKGYSPLEITVENGSNPEIQLTPLP